MRAVKDHDDQESNKKVEKKATFEHEERSTKVILKTSNLKVNGV